MCNCNRIHHYMVGQLLMGLALIGAISGRKWGVALGAVGLLLFLDDYKDYKDCEKTRYLF